MKNVVNADTVELAKSTSFISHALDEPRIISHPHDDQTGWPCGTP